MTGLLQALEASGPATVLRTSFYLYPVLNALHILAIGALVTSVLLMDLRVLGIWRALTTDSITGLLRPVAIIALVIAVMSGGLLFSVRPLDYAANPAFQLKLVLLALALLNAAVFIGLGRDAVRRPAMRILALFSLLAWPSVLLAGRFIGFME